MFHHVLFAMLGLALVVPLTAQDKEAPERFTAAAVSPGGPRTAAGVGRVDITIERWSSPEERQQLMTTLKEKGADALLNTLRSLKPVGRISTPGEVGFPLHYAHQVKTGNGRRIFIATDRPVGYWEAVTRPRVADYPFTFIEMRLDEKGEGEGRLAPAAQLNVAGNVIEVVNYGAQPVALTQVRHEAQ
jgi:hypothetical protein